MADDVARLVATLEADISKFTKGMETAQKVADQRLGQIEKRLQQTQSLFGSGFSNLASIASKFGVALSVASIAAFAKNVIDSTAAINNQAAKLGISTDALQAYHAAALLAGVGADEGDAAIQRFTRSIGDAAEAQGPARKAFQELGLSASDLAGGPETALPKVAAAILKIQDVSQRARIEVALFGKSGQAAEQLLQGWADPNLIKKMGDLGLVIDKALIDRAEQATIKWDIFWLKLKIGALDALDVLSKLDKASQSTIAGRANVDPRHTSEVPSQFHFSDTNPLSSLAGAGPGPQATEQWKGVNKAFDDFLAKQTLAAQLAGETTAQRRIDQAVIEAATAKLKDQGKELETIKTLEQARAVVGSAGVAKITAISNQEALNKMLGEGLDRIDQIKASAGSVTWDQKFLDGLAAASQSSITSAAAKGTPDASKILAPEINRQATQTVVDDLQQQATLAALLPKEREAELVIMEEEHRRNIFLSDDQKEQIRQAIDLRQHNEDIVDTIGQMQSSFEDFLKTAETEGKVSFGSLFRSILGNWLDLQNKMLAQSLFSSSGGGGLFGSLPGLSNGNVGSGILGGVASLLGFANGGSPPVGRASIVGEKGPELFVPRVAGTIVPNGAGGGSVINIDARGAQIGVAEQIADAIKRAAPSIAGGAVNIVRSQLPGMMQEAQARFL